MSADCRLRSAEYTLHQGDCLDILPTLEANSVDAVICDPPYGLGFMGKDWDHGVPGEHFWREVLRVAKPGAHLLAFGGTRTFHRLAVAIEDAGWEIRDTVMWVYGSGFPKSLDVSKAIDKAAGAERGVVGNTRAGIKRNGRTDANGGIFVGGLPEDLKHIPITAPATPDAQRWAGWGTALKPAWEPIIVARKPLIGTVAENVLAWGTGAINVDGCRVEHDEVCKPMRAQTDKESMTGNGKVQQGGRHKDVLELKPAGRWPANLIHDGSEEVLGLFPVTGASNTRQPTGKPMFPTSGCAVNWNANSVMDTMQRGHNDTGGSAARFFYCAKASKADRDEGCEGLGAKRTTFADGTGLRNNGDGTPRNQEPSNRNHHPTVKPTDLMRYLVRLVTPPNGVVLDPFMGSGSTGKAAMLERMRFVGIELDAEYYQIAQRRIDAAARQLRLNPEPLPVWADGVLEEMA